MILAKNEQPACNAYQGRVFGRKLSCVCFLFDTFQDRVQRFGGVNGGVPFNDVMRTRCLYLLNNYEN